MGALAKIFGPIVEFAEVNLDEVKIVAFDTNGTLVHHNTSKLTDHNFVADFRTARLLRDLKENQNKLGLDEVVIISGHPAQAEAALEDAGLGGLVTQPVEDRMTFYQRARNTNVLVVDDDFMLAMEAQAHVNPRAKKVQDYLGTKAYRKELDPS